MATIPICRLGKKGRKNHWVVGTPKDVQPGSIFYSTQVQIWNGIGRKDDERLHLHYPPVEEYYIPLKGSLTLQIGKITRTLHAMQLAKVAPNICHQVVKADGAEYLTIRVPACGNDKKKDCSPSDL